MTCYFTMTFKLERLSFILSCRESVKSKRQGHPKAFMISRRDAAKESATLLERQARHVRHVIAKERNGSRGAA